MGYNIKVPVTSKPAKLPRTYDRSKYVICLEDLLIPGTVTPMFEQRRHFLVEESCANYRCFLVKRLESGYVFYIIKHAEKLKSLQS